MAITSIKTRKTLSAQAASRPSAKGKVYINVAYKDRELAKRLGARWDASVKRWYCPADSTLALIYKWRKAPAVAAVGVSEVTPLNDSTAEATPLTRSVREVRRPAPRALPKAMPAPSLFDTLDLPLAS